MSWDDDKDGRKEHGVNSRENAPAYHELLRLIAGLDSWRRQFECGEMSYNLLVLCLCNLRPKLCADYDLETLDTELPEDRGRRLLKKMREENEAGDR
jgi:hypothetical protein